MQRKLGLAIACMMLLGLLTGCTTGTVSKVWTDAQGICWIEIVDNDNKLHKFQQDAVACQRCKVGDTFPDCKDERSGDKPKQPPKTTDPAPPPQPPVRTETEGPAAILHVTITVVDAGFDFVIYVLDKDGRQKGYLDGHERTRDKSWRIPVVSTDRTIYVSASSTVPGSLMTCEVKGPAGVPWMPNPVVGQGDVACSQKIQGRI
jgi:hypothetical protein